MRNTLLAVILRNVSAKLFKLAAPAGLTLERNNRSTAQTVFAVPFLCISVHRQVYHHATDSLWPLYPIFPFRMIKLCLILFGQGD